MGQALICGVSLKASLSKQHLCVRASLNFSDVTLVLKPRGTEMAFCFLNRLICNNEVVPQSVDYGQQGFM